MELKRNSKKIIIPIAVVIIVTIGLNLVFSSRPVYYTSNESKLIIYKPDEIKSYVDDFQVIEKDQEKIIYVSAELLKNEFNIYYDYDIENNILVITTDNKVFRFYGNENTVKINREKAENIPPMIVIEDSPQVPIKYLEADLNLTVKINDENNSVLLKSNLNDEIVANISRDNIKVRVSKSIWDDYIDLLNRGDKVWVLEKDNLWRKILTSGGQIGYIAANEIENEKTILGEEIEKKEPIWKPKDGKIILTWEHVISRNPDTSKINDMKGVNVISPTWVSLSNSSGKISNNIDRDYINWAHNRGYKVWALFSNSFDPKLTDEFLNNSLAREIAINDLLDLMIKNNIDGVNIDFENVYLKNKENLVQFVRELVPVFHEEDLVVSMDVTVRGGSENWSLFYDRKELGKVVDYIAVMTYDEHWRSSPESGSVASIGWVERGVQGLLEEVPSNKLLLGMPLYTRLWIETPSKTKVEDMDVKSKVLWMDDVKEILKKDNIVKIWDDTAGQYYIAYIENNKLHKIWVEDAESIALKTELVNKYDLAGVAAWRRGFETEDIWDAIYNILKKDR